MFVLVASGARANGRFPRGEHVIEYPSDPNRLLLAATYGLLNTSDGGKNWYYVCESAFSLEPMTPGYTGDPLLAVTADDSLLADVQSRITRSSDAACNWAKAFEESGKAVDDIAVAPSNRNIVVALVRTVATSAIQVYESTDSGTTWAPIGTPLTTIKLGTTIDVDPKDPTHLMVTGLTDFTPDVDTGAFLNSTNHGMTWSSSPIPNTNIDRQPYIAAVHPTDSKKVFVRTDEWVEDVANSATLARDALFYTKDGGQTWSELLRATGSDGNGAKLFGFALSPDGSTVLAGYGDPVQGGGRNVNHDVMGVYKSSGADYSFGASPTPVFVESASCITWTAKGIYICGSPDGMTQYVAFANDVSKVTSTGLTKIMTLDKLKGEPPCCSGRAVTACDWNVDCMRFDACADGGTSMQPDAGVCMMPEPRPEGGAGAGGSAGDAGPDRDGSAGTGTGGAGTGGSATGGASGSATGGAGGSSTGGAGGSGTGGAGGGDGCNCRMAAPSSGRPLAALGLLLGLVGASGRRRSSRRPKRAA
jgi:MYXO-CTERM domain-containing protein